MTIQWYAIEAQRQIRPDHMVEVLVNGEWHLGYSLVWMHNHTLGHPHGCIGQWVRFEARR